MDIVRETPSNNGSPLLLIQPEAELQEDKLVDVLSVYGIKISRDFNHITYYISGRRTGYKKRDHHAFAELLVWL